MKPKSLTAILKTKTGREQPIPGKKHTRIHRVCDKPAQVITETPSATQQRLQHQSILLVRQATSPGTSSDVKDPERLFIQMEGFGRDEKWARKMEKAIQEAVERIDEFDSGQKLIDFFEEKYEKYIKAYFKQQKDMVVTFIGTIDMPANEKKEAAKFWETVFDKASILRTGETHTPISGKYEPYRERALKLCKTGTERTEVVRIKEMIDSISKSDKDFLKQLFRSLRRTYGKAAVDIPPIIKFRIKEYVMKGKIGKGTIKLTKTVATTIDDEDLTGVGWFHTNSAYFPKIRTHIDNLFDSAMKLRKHINSGQIPQNEKSLKALTKLTGQIHWWFSHMTPFTRGSAGIGDMFSKVILDSCGIAVPKWRKGIAPDLEAFVTPQKEYMESYGDLFENPLSWAREEGTVRV